MSQSELSPVISRLTLWLARTVAWILSWLSPITRKAISEAIFPEGVTTRALDPMTRLFTQAEFLLARPSADDDPDVAYVLFDITGQSEVNNSLGEDAGDALIMAAAAAIRDAAAAYESNRVFRRGGDESAVLTTPRNAHLIAKTAQSILAARMARGVVFRDTNGGEHPATIFAGHELYAVTGATFADADLQLRQAKAHFRQFGTMP